MYCFVLTLLGLFFIHSRKEINRSICTGLEALLDIPGDADDETMVELAMVLSLQEGSGSAPATGGRGTRAGPGSDATASAAGSDDEEGEAATGGRAVASESGSGASGRSSAYGEIF